MPDDDLRERIARAIEAEADRTFEKAFSPAEIATAEALAAAFRRAAEVARGTPDALAELAARVADLEGRLRDLEEGGADDGR